MDCGPAGEARLAWALPKWTNPDNVYSGSYSFDVDGSDTAGGVLVTRYEARGHFDQYTDLTLDADGVTRIASIGSALCGPIDGCSGSLPVASGGVLYTLNRAVLATNGALLYGWDEHLPVGADPSIVYSDGTPSASNGELTLFAANRHWTQSPSSGLAALLDRSGATRWTRVFDGQIAMTAVDDSGIAIVGLLQSSQIAVAPDGSTLYELAPPAVDPSLQYLQSAAGYLYRSGDSNLLDVATGKPSVVLPFIPVGQAILSASRIIVAQARQGQSGPVAAVDLATASIAWQRDASVAGAAGDRTLLVDSAHVLHVVEPDGADAIACQLPTQVYGFPLLLGAGRLVLSHAGNVEAYDLPVTK